MTGIPGVSDFANAAGLGNVVSGLQTANQVNNIVNAAQSGNVLGALTAGANLTGVGGTQIGDTGYNVSDALKTANIANALDKGNFAPLVGALASGNAISGPKSSDFEVGSFGTPGGPIDPSTYGSVDMTSGLGPYTPTTDFGFKADYSLFPSRSGLEDMGGGTGVTAPGLPDTFNSDGSINYNLFNPTPGGGEPSLQMPTAPNLGDMGGGQGLLPGGPPSNYVPDLGDPNSFINKPAPGGDVSDAVKRAIGTPSGQPSTAPGTRTATTAAQPAAQSSPGKEFSWLDTTPQMLKNTPVTNQNPIQLTELQQMYQGLSPEMQSVFASRGINAPMGYAKGGSSTCNFWGDLSEYMPKFEKSAPTMLQNTGGRRQPLALNPLKHIMPTISPQGNIGGLAQGGLPTKYKEAAPEGHNPEFVTGLTGYYAGGRGTGQSDDIPAMLHDGDYVIDAEAVSALGDGSSKAGKDALTGFLREVPHRDGAQGKPVPAKIADGEFVLPESFVTALGNGDNKRGAKMLDMMRENLRAHKRSAPTSKIPPKALSPLDYLKKAK